MTNPQFEIEKGVKGFRIMAKRNLYCVHGHYRTSKTLDKKGNCTICRDNRGPNWIKRNPEKFKLTQRKSALKRKYGLTLEQYNELSLKQNNRCAACLQHSSGFVVDHSHATGKIRGLLCNGCNLALGNAKDSILILQGLITYLKERG